MTENSILALACNLELSIRHFDKFAKMENKELKYYPAVQQLPKYLEKRDIHYRLVTIIKEKRWWLYGWVGRGQIGNKKNYIHIFILSFAISLDYILRIFWHIKFRLLVCNNPKCMDNVYVDRVVPSAVGRRRSADGFSFTWRNVTKFIFNIVRTNIIIFELLIKAPISG